MEREVRAEDAFDVAAVAEWLRANANDARGLEGVPTVRQFTGGVSNLTYLLSYPEREVILRRPPKGSKAKSAHDMRREYDVQRLLKPAFGAVPQMIAFCEDANVLGSDFYVMERLKGVILRRDLPKGTRLSKQQARALCETYLDKLVELHRVDVAATGLDTFSKGDGYVARQVSGWSDRYRRARTKNVGSFEKVMAWLAANQPADRGACFIHNDYRLDNLVLDETNLLHVRGVLDWELATVGDPLMDLGSALAYWIEADDFLPLRMFRRQPTNVPGMLTRSELVARYAQQTGQLITPEQWRFYEVFGLFRLAVIAQQVYFRYFHKQTTNPAFKPLRWAVLILELRCRWLINARAR